MDDIGAILHFNNDGAGVKIHFWNATAESFTSGVVVPVIGEAGDLQTPLIEVVTSPSWKRDGKLMYAVAASMGTGRVYGFFANPDGSGAVFQLLADVGTGIGSLASRDGSTVLVGMTNSGRILWLSAATGVATDFAVPVEFQSGSVIRLADLAPTRAFALNNGILLRYDGAAWKQTSYFGVQMFEADPEPGSGRIFAATDSSVYLSLDDGATWSSASLGLPARPHCTDLRIASDGAGGHDLYLATYGRSVWKAKIDFTPKGPDFQHVPQLVGEALFGILGDGGGAFRVGGQIIWIPPREPLRNILAAIAIDELARSMTSNLGRNIRMTAMETIRQIAEAQVQELERGP